MKPEECPLCWKFNCQCWREHAARMEARQGRDAQRLDGEAATAGNAAQTST